MTYIFVVIFEPNGEAETKTINDYFVHSTILEICEACVKPIWVMPPFNMASHGTIVAIYFTST